MLYYVVARGNLVYGFLFWPLLGGPVAGDTTFLTELSSLLVKFVEFLGTPRGRLYLLFEGLLLGSAVLAWLIDGYPGTRLLKWRPDRRSEDLRERQWPGSGEGRSRLRPRKRTRGGRR